MFKKRTGIDKTYIELYYIINFLQQMHEHHVFFNI